MRLCHTNACIHVTFQLIIFANNITICISYNYRISKTSKQEMTIYFVLLYCRPLYFIPGTVYVFG